MAQAELSKTCPGCAMIQRAADHPAFICELDASIAFLHEHQAYPGWCVLMLKQHHEHLHMLPRSLYIQLQSEVQHAAACIAQATGSGRINYECLGNQLNHIHWHIVPRYTPPLDPSPLAVVWVRPPQELNCGVTPEQRSDMIHRLRAAGLR